MRFHVIDKQTGKEPDLEQLEQIAIHELWANTLILCHLGPFAIDEDGCLLLLDKCGNYVYCPADKFEMQFDEG